MALARWQSTVVDEAGNVLPGAQVTVRREMAGAPLAVLYQDRDGLVPLGNPFPAAGDGFAAFHAAGGAFRIDAVSGSSTRTWRYVPIGLAAEADGLATGIRYLFQTAIADADPGEGFFRFNHATLASVTQIFLDNVGLNGVNLSAWLNSFDDGGSAGDRGNLIIEQDDGAGFFVATVTGSVVDGTGYRKVTVTPVATGGAFTAGKICSVSLYRRGTDGTGDVNGPAGGVVNNEFTLFNGTGGKTVKGSGLLTATNADARAAAANRVLTASLIETASAGVALADAATVAVDWDAAINFTLTVTANRLIGNPTNGQPGTWRTILVQGNDATDRTISFANQYLGEVPAITDCDNARWYLLMIFCVSATHFVVSSKKANGT